MSLKKFAASIGAVGAAGVLVTKGLHHKFVLARKRVNPSELNLEPGKTYAFDKYDIPEKEWEKAIAKSRSFRECIELGNFDNFVIFQNGKLRKLIPIDITDLVKNYK